MKNLQHQITILLIENNSDWLINVYSALQEAGYDVLIATGGNEGFCLARRVRPDLIISETELPDISGVELCRMIRADKDLHAALFVLIGELRGRDSEAAVDGFDAGADDLLEEACNPQFLAAKVARLIEFQSAKDEIQFDYQMLRRSEQHLAKIIDDTSKLIDSLDPTFKYSVYEEPYTVKSKNFFDRTGEQKKQKAEKPLYLPKKNDDALLVWKQSLQVKDFDDTEELGKERCEKVYYEIAS
jgi:response regulator RpfG family c-di-GMP phosphodiesterase